MHLLGRGCHCTQAPSFDYDCCTHQQTWCLCSANRSAWMLTGTGTSPDIFYHTLGHSSYSDLCGVAGGEHHSASTRGHVLPVAAPLPGQRQPQGPAPVPPTPPPCLAERFEGHQSQVGLRNGPLAECAHANCVRLWAIQTTL